MYKVGTEHIHKTENNYCNRYYWISTKAGTYNLNYMNGQWTASVIMQDLTSQTVTDKSKPLLVDIGYYYFLCQIV